MILLPPFMRVASQEYRRTAVSRKVIMIMTIATRKYPYNFPVISLEPAAAHSEIVGVPPENPVGLPVVSPP